MGGVQVMSRFGSFQFYLDNLSSCWDVEVGSHVLNGLSDGMCVFILKISAYFGSQFLGHSNFDLGRTDIILKLI